MLPPCLIGYYRGDFPSFGVKGFKEESVLRDFIRENASVDPDLLPQINFQKRQVVVISRDGPELIGLFAIEETAEKVCRITLKRIIQKDDIRGTSCLLICAFPKEYTLNFFIQHPVTLDRLIPSIRKVKNEIASVKRTFDAFYGKGDRWKETTEALEQQWDRLDRQKAYLEWKTVFRYCGESLEECDSFNTQEFQ